VGGLALVAADDGEDVVEHEAGEVFVEGDF